MRAPRVLLVALFAVLAASAAPGEIPCRNLKGEAKCAAEERARAKDRPSVAPDQASEVRIGDVVRVERILVEADPEDLMAPEPTRWEKFERSLKGAIMTEVIGNDGVRMWCTDPCPKRVNCCVRARGFDTTGRNAGQ